MKNKNLTTGIIIVVIIVVITIGLAYYQETNSNSNNLFSREKNSKSALSENAEYKDGIYDAIGSYISPGGAEELGVKLTLLNGIVVDSSVEVLTDREISLEMQEDFAANYHPFVLGKSIDEIELTKVSGSSLTPNGFNDALEKIKVQARS